MRDSPFFAEIEHVEVPWGDRTAPCPMFFYDAMTFGGSFVASTDRVRELLPSGRLNPYRISPGSCVVHIAVNRFRDSDIGPYDEVLVGVPITLDRKTPLFTGSIRRLPGDRMMYVHTLPVTTEIARDLGVEFAGFPKYLADIDIEETDTSIACTFTLEDQHVMTIQGKKPETEPTPRSRTVIFTHRKGCILRSGFVASEAERGSSRNPADFTLELGDHSLAGEIRELKLGKMLNCQYSPSYQAIETPVLESFQI
jgi:hypothetical protein